MAKDVESVRTNKLQPPPAMRLLPQAFSSVSISAVGFAIAFAHSHRT